ncbi:DUF6651 domain-containing protein [Candidatus Fukatsuia symbiotica]|uniref:DUF6651 domain-containing protein n=2 Tax=Candidatus Fukatsuia symbiotica TaxID=1878942 RepID=A0A2U8I4W8_9GAMM|nr:DUF6651 domain-containing protein [Candidatus Fukatsuia symbiotica]AWK14206.1 hypothetical protein CCS41_06505 [Candidatus Fukatsuia symbiotica]MEA9444448.1 DUF6651 domain-containing protein [Candidatus Fukatsuia symbiotica]
MKLHLDTEGKAVLENGMPVYLHEDGKAIPFDAVAALNKISALNGEAKNHREAKEALEAKLKAFAGIDDPAKAREALQTLTHIDQKKLIEAGAVDQVKAQITQAFQTQLDEASSKNKTLEAQLYQEMIGGRFSSSTFIQDNLAIPADLVQARFGHAFSIDAGKVVATDTAGNKVFSRRQPGEIAEFEEALEYLIEQYPHKDHILKASGHRGGGSQPTPQQHGQKTLKRSAFDALDIGSKQAALKDGISIVD